MVQSIYQIAWDVSDGTADPAEARNLLECFCECVDNGTPIPKELVLHLRNAFRNYLDDKRQIEFAMGLKMKKGRPKADQSLPIKMAAEVLKQRMRKLSHKFALGEVAGQFHCGVTKVSEAWKNHQLDAILAIRHERPLAKFPWTPKEMKILDSMFRGQPWYISSPKK